LFSVLVGARVDAVMVALFRLSPPWRWLPVAIVLPLAPWIAVYLAQSWERPAFRFIPLLLVVCGWLLLSRYRPSYFGRGGLVGIVLGLGGVALAASGVVQTSPWAVYAGAVGMLAVVAGHWRRPEDQAAAWPVWLLLGLSVRPPSITADWLTGALQSSSTRVASLLLDSLQVIHYRAGNVIELPQARFMVEEACSGVQSVYTLIFVAAALAVYYRRSLVQAAVLVLSAAFWAAAMNVFRIVGVILMQAWFQEDWTAGWRHDLIGYVALALALVLLWSTDRLVYLLTAPVLEREKSESMYSQLNPLILIYNRWIGGSTEPFRQVARPLTDGPRSAAPTRAAAPAVGIVFGICLLLGVGGFPASWGVIRAAERQASRSLEALPIAEGALPGEIGPWRLVEFTTERRDSGSQFGEWSSVWNYQSSEMNARVSLDHFFNGWHDLMICYEMIGWKVLEREAIADQGEPARTVSVVLLNPSGQRALLLYSLFRLSGEPLPVPDTLRGMWTYRFQPDTRRTVQAQLLIPLRDLPNDRQREQALELHRATCDSLRAAVTQLGEGK